jgi:hypothetical protein
MRKSCRAKLIEAGFTLVRPAINVTVIKKADKSTNGNWVTMQKFETLSARDKYSAELENDPLIIFDE